MQILKQATLTAGIAVGCAGSAFASDTVMTNASYDEVRSVVADMLADAESRSSLLQGTGAAGYDGGFFIESGDGDFKLNVKGFMQFRYNLNSRDDNTIGDDFDVDFNNARTLMFFKGHVADPNLTYQIRFNFNRATGASALDDAFINYKLDDNWSVRAGQGLHPFSREWYHGDVKLQTVERSLVALMFGEGRTQQVSAQYRDDDLRFTAAISDGFRSANSDLTAGPADLALTARAEYKAAGEWGDVIGAYTSTPGSDYALLLGGAVHFEQGPDVGGAQEQDLFAWTADATVKGDGWNAFLTGTGYHVTDEAGVAGADFDDYGLVAQGGYYLDDDVELFGRYTALFPDDARGAGADETFEAIALGVNYYIHGHAVRFTVQGEWFFDSTTGTAIGNFGGTGGRNPGSTLFGLLPSDSGDQLALTAQLQLFF